MSLGGSEMLVFNIIRNLDRNRFSPHVAWLSTEKPMKQFLDLGIPLYHVPKVKRFDISTMFQLSKIVQKNDIHVVNAHHFLSAIYAFYGTKINNSAKLIYTEHSEWEIEDIKFRWVLAGKILFRYIDAVVGISDKVTTRLQSTFSLSQKKVHTIENGVDCKLFNVAQDKIAYRNRYNFSIDDVIIGVVANLKKNKNHLYLLKAFHSLSKKYNYLKLLIIGAGFANDPAGSETEIRNYISAAGLEKNVLFLGGRSDIPDLLKAMDIFCLTSYKEGLPISLIEAMATGLPVVGTNVEGIKDVIIPEENGFLVQPDDEEELIHVLEKLIIDSSLRTQMGEKSRQIALSKYKFEDCVNQYQDLFL